MTLKPPPLSNDCFALPSGVHWTPVDEAIAHLHDTIPAITATQRVSVSDALGLYLAEPAICARAHPPAPNSAVDGYGFAATSQSEGANHLTLVEGRSAAGAPFAGGVPAGMAIRILTGAIMPDGVDTVILEEDVNTSDTQIAFAAPLRQGANCRKAGEDMQIGQVLLPKGHKITPADLGTLSAAGISHVAVHHRLRVGILSTGDEITSADQAYAPHQTIDANRPMLGAIIKRWGYEDVDLGIVADDPDVLRKTLDDAAGRVDILLTSGGASAGDEDHMSRLLQKSGAMTLWRIAMKPGRPLAMGLWNGCPVIGLPGNPVAAFVCTLVLARPALSQLAGGTAEAPLAFQVPAGFAKSKKPGRREYLRAQIVDGLATPFASEGSGRVSGLSWASGLIELPDEAMTIERGDLVTFIPFGSFGL